MTLLARALLLAAIVFPSTTWLGAPQSTGPSSIDFTSGEPLPMSTDTMPDFIGETNVPAFSHDGKSLAYITTRRGIGGRKVLAIANLETGQTREFRPRFPDFTGVAVTAQQLHWSPDGRALALVSRGEQSGASIHLIDMQTGAVRSVATANSELRLWSKDNKLYFDRDVGSTDLSLIEHDVASGREREIFRAPAADSAERRSWFNQVTVADGQTMYFRRDIDAEAERSEVVARDLRTGTERVLMTGRQLGRIIVSPDGRHLIVYRYLKPHEDPFVLTVVPTSGSPIRELRPQSVYFRAWSADGQSLIGDSHSRDQLAHWWVPIDGRPARQIEMLGRLPLEMNISPDGRQFVYKQSSFFDQAPLTELWAIDLPVQARPATPPVSPSIAQTIRERLPVAWSVAVLPGTRVVPGGSFNVTVTAEIDPGWWVYAMSQPPGGPIAMTVEMPQTQPFALAGKIVEPQPTKKIDRTFDNQETLFHEGTPAFTIPVRVNAGTAAGRHELTVDIEYQACSAERCLRPTTIALTIHVNVTAR